MTVRAVVHELAAAEAVIYGRRQSRREYARGVEHALMWAQYATAAPPAPWSGSRRLLIESALEIRHGGSSWTYSGCTRWTPATANPRVVHGLLPRDVSGYRTEQTWDALGMRASESNDTIIDRAFVADEDVALICPAGFGGAGPFQVAVFGWALLGFAHVYAGIAQRPRPCRTCTGARRRSTHRVGSGRAAGPSAFHRDADGVDVRVLAHPAPRAVVLHAHPGGSASHRMTRAQISTSCGSSRPMFGKQV